MNKLFDCDDLAKGLGKGISSMFANPKMVNIIIDKNNFVLLDSLPHNINKTSTLKLRRCNLFKAKKINKRIYLMNNIKECHNWHS